MVLFFLGLLFLDRGVDAVDKKAVTSGISTANLSVGAELGPARAAISSEGDQDVVKKYAAESYLIIGSDRQRAFVHSYLLNIADETAAPVTPSVPSPVQKSADTEVKEAGKQPDVSTPPTSTPAPATTGPAPAVPRPIAKVPPPTVQSAATKTGAAKPKSILQMIEGHEEEFNIGLLIAAAAFALGWICGGSYYVRRERKRRGKLRF